MSKARLEDLYAVFNEHRKISTDTRKIIPGSIFFALRGDNFDGNTFAKQALDLGAAFAVVDDPGYRPDERMILVDNVLGTLQQLAVMHRATLNIPILGITGTNGKTTTKELIYAVLSTQRATVATAGNLNNHIGVPLTLLSISPATEIAVIEMGANHPGEIAFLCSLASPTHGIITNIGKAHLEGFGSFEGVIKTKSELYNFIRNHKGLLFVNVDDPLLVSLANGIDQARYGRAADASIRGRLVSADPFISFEFDDQAATHSVQTKILGEYNFENLLAAVTIGNYFGISAGNICRSIAEYTPSNSRSQVIQTTSNFVIMDAYNANPTSMKAALLNFRNLERPHKLVILGGMKELGAESHKEHYEIVRLVRDLHFENALFAGEEFSEIARQFGFREFKDSNETLEYLRLNPVKDCSVLIKGSRGSRMEVVIEAL